MYNPNPLTNDKSNEIQFIETLKASNEELIKMYIRKTNKFALREMRARGLF